MSQNENLLEKYYINHEDPIEQNIQETQEENNQESKPYKYVYYDWDDTLGLDI